MYIKKKRIGKNYVPCMDIMIVIFYINLEFTIILVELNIR